MVGTMWAELLAEHRNAAMVTLDREEDLAAARDDPGLFLDALGTPAVIDEVQRAGDPLVLAIKQRLDSRRDPGQYVLTGSTNFLTTPALSESLAGRIDLITLWPLSQGAIDDGNDDSVDRAFRGTPGLLNHAAGGTPSRSDYLERICRGGFPEVQNQSERTRRRWFERYLETVLRREVESVAAVGPLVESFVVAEIAKQLTWCETSARLHHLRDRDGLEVNAVIEASDGRVVAVEVKSTTVPRPADAAPMAAVRDRLDRVGRDFVVGVVFHTGDRRVPLGDRLVRLPIVELWA